MLKTVAMMQEQHFVNRLVTLAPEWRKDAQNSELPRAGRKGRRGHDCDLWPAETAAKEATVKAPDPHWKVGIQKESKRE